MSKLQKQFMNLERTQGGLTGSDITHDDSEIDLSTAIGSKAQAIIASGITVNTSRKESFLVDVTGLPADSSVSLPSSPIEGSVYRFAVYGDMTGTSFTVNGNGNNIEDDTFFLFDDAGNFEFTFIGTQWLVTSFSVYPVVA